MLKLKSLHKFVTYLASVSVHCVVFSSHDTPLELVIAVAPNKNGGLYYTTRTVSVRRLITIAKTLQKRNECLTSYPLRSKQIQLIGNFGS